MILQLHGYPINVDGVELGACNSTHYSYVVKLMRWMLLNESDWVMLPDSPLSDSDRQDWKQWRQYLRDLGDTFNQELGETLEITDPPVNYRPETWVNLTPDALWSHSHDDGHTH